MPTTIEPDELCRLYDSERGVIDPSIYTDERIHQAELERIFGAAACQSRSVSSRERSST